MLVSSFGRKEYAICESLTILNEKLGVLKVANPSARPKTSFCALAVVYRSAEAQQTKSQTIVDQVR